MFITQTQIQELQNIIKTNHLFFIAKNVGEEMLTKEDKIILKKYGFDLSSLKGKIPHIEEAFRFGILSKSLKEMEAKKMNYSQLKDYLKTDKWLPLSDYEKNVLDSVKNQSLNDIKGLGDKIVKENGYFLTQIDKEKRAKYQDLIRGEAKEAILNRESVQDLVSRLGNKTQDWNRDFGRIADFIMHTAFDEGRATTLQQTYGKDTLVYKDVYTGACKECIRLYTTAGLGTKPIIFKLDQLISNGNNIGRKTADWKAVIGPTHPWCRCTLQKVPEGMSWDDKVGGFIKIPTKRRVINRPKIRVTIGNETKYV